MLEEISTFLCSDLNIKRLLFIFFGRKTLLQTWFKWEKFDTLVYQLWATEKENDVFVVIVSPLKSIVNSKEQIEEMEEDYFHCIVCKGRHASADWRSKIQSCFGKTVEDILDAKFQNML